jgi:signal peptidase I
MSTAVSLEQPASPGSSEQRYSTLRLLAGLLGRTWLWFVGGCLLITLLPVLIGWRPFVVESGSMAPRIHVGDVVLAAPAAQASDLVGRVTVFDDPAKPGTTKTHRIITLNPDGTMVSKGDANPTADSTLVRFSDVRGLGRLLVSYVGLPLIWVQQREFGLLALFLLSLLLAGWFVNRDQEDDVEAADDHPSGPGPGNVVPLPVPSSSGDAGASQVAASTPLDPGLRRAASPPRITLRMIRARAAYVAALTAVLLIPATSASFAATARNTANAWSTGNWDYTSTVTALNPWLYWKLDETTGTTAADSSGNGRTGTYNTSAASFTFGVPGALTTDTPNLGVTLNGTTACLNTTSTTTMNAPVQITEVVWFKTTTSQGGKLLGFEMPRTGVAMPGSGGTYDRHLYMDGAGKLWFGVYNGGYFTIPSPTALNDGTWHMAAASMGAGGMSLYIDGTLVGTNANNAGETTTGWFRAGCGNLGGWGGSWTGANSPTTSTNPTQNRPFAGSLDEISVWQSVLTAAQIRAMYIAK